MKVLVFDTETTNLIKKDLTDVHVLQLAWVLYDTETNSCEQNKRRFIILLAFPNPL